MPLPGRARPVSLRCVPCQAYSPVRHAPQKQVCKPAIRAHRSRVNLHSWPWNHSVAPRMNELEDELEYDIISLRPTDSKSNDRRRQSALAARSAGKGFARRPNEFSLCHSRCNSVWAMEHPMRTEVNFICPQTYSRRGICGEEANRGLHETHPRSKNVIRRQPISALATDSWIVEKFSPDHQMRYGSRYFARSRYIIITRGGADLRGNQGPATPVWGEGITQSARDRGLNGTKFDVFLKDP